MGIIRRSWNALTFIAGVYAVVNQLKNLNSAKNDLYSQLSPEQQAEWNKIFGSPEAVQIQNPTPVSPITNQVESIQAGV